VMGVARAGLEACAHPGAHRGLTRIGRENRLALENIDKFVLARMGVAQRRHTTRRQSGQVDPEMGQAEDVAQRPPDAPRDARRERLGIASAGSAGGTALASVATGLASSAIVSSLPSDRSCRCRPTAAGLSYRAAVTLGIADRRGRELALANTVDQPLHEAEAPVSEWVAQYPS